MDKSRASEIASSPEMIDVTYNGKPIYIEQVSPTKDTVSVHFLNRPEYSQEVSVNDLIEAK